MNSSILYGDREIYYEIIRTPILSKKVRIHVHPNACVEVEAPEINALAEIDSAVRKRARWICRQLEQIEEMKKYALPREYVSGETHFYIGRRYCLKVTESRDQEQGIKLRAGRIEMTTRIDDPIVVRRRLKGWYKERAEFYFSKRLLEISRDIKWLEHVPEFKLVTMQKQWGSCSPDGVIHLNPWLIRAPTDCIDYVITHELCHLRERNHSKKYYEILQQHSPNWKHVKTKLDGMAELLLAE